mgnify:CR=1 FL=1|tara:strand:+ start:412 stop:1386 length:975 start_codon:yes stop_codon:yes gene_type:complete
MIEKKFKLIAKNAAQKQIGEMKKVNRVFNNSFLKAIDLIHNCKGHIICSGIGKSRIVADRASKLFSSVGIPSFSISAQDFSHGDSGAINTKKDVLLVFSYSGDSVELTDLVNFSSRYHIPLIGVASKENSLLLKSSNIKILLPKVKESDPTGLVPTSSFSLTLLVIDCLCVCLMKKSKFSAAKFKRFHSGGQIGKQLITCKEIMFKGKKLPTVSANKTIEESIKIITKGSLGVAVITKNNLVQGIVTDGDVRRSKFPKNYSVLKICTKKPLYVSENLLVSKALSIMNNKKITSLLCSNDEDYKKKKTKFKLKGIVHMHNVIKVQ